MAETLASVSGGIVDVQVAGKTYRLSAVTLGHYAQIESRLIAKRKGDVRDAVRVAVAEAQLLPEEIRVPFIKDAFERLKDPVDVSIQEVMYWMTTPAGMLYTIALCALENHPEFAGDVDAALSVFSKVSADAIELVAEKMKKASGEEELGNSSGRESTTATAQG